MARVKASRLQLAAACPAAPTREEPFPFVDTPASVRGSELHERVSTLIQGGAGHFDEICGDLEAADAAAVRMCLTVARRYTPSGTHNVFNEYKTNQKKLGMGNGIVDYAVYDVGSGTLVVIDWKFGAREVAEPSDNKQVISYVLTLADEIGLPVNKAIVAVCQPNIPDELLAQTPRPWEDNPAAWEACVEASIKQAVLLPEAFTQWERTVKDVVAAAKAPRPTVCPGYHCRGLFCEASKHPGACPEYDAWAATVAQAKQDAKEADAAQAVAGYNPITVTRDDVVVPVVVMSVEAIQKAEDLLARAKALDVFDEETATVAAAHLNSITKFEGQVETNRTAVKKPFLDIGREIDAAAKQGLVPLGEGKALLKKKLDDYVNAENAKREKLRKQQEEEQRKALEAQQQAQREADAALEKAKTSTTAADAEAALKAKAEAERKLKEAQQVVNAPTVAPAPVKVAGTKTVHVPEWRVPEEKFKLMPDAYKVVDVKALEAAIKSKRWGDGQDAPEWLEVKWVDKIQGSGSR